MARSDWARVPLGQILTQVFDEVKVKDGVTYAQVTVRMHNKGLVLRQKVDGQAIKTKRQFRVREGQFVFSRIDARNGAMGLVPPELDGAIVSNDFPVFDIRTDLVDRNFFKYFVSTAPFLDACLAQSKGTSNRRRLKEPDFLEISIPLPPLAEQQRIVARIDALAARIAEAQKLQAEATEEAEGFFEATVNAVFAEVKQTNHQPLAELTSRIGSGSTPKGGREVYLESGIPFIRSLNVRMRQFKLDNLVYIDEATHQAMRRTWVEPNDVLLNITGASIGRVACVPIEFQTANVSQHVAIIRPLPELDSRYLMYCLSQPMVQDLINHQQKGATRQGFTKAQIEQLQIPVPPLNEQRRIVAYLDRVQARVDALKQLQAQTQKELDALLPSVLDKAFRGEL
jgi:type I restriction enzyme S subunit